MKSKPDQEHRTLPGTHDVVGFSGALVGTPFQESLPGNGVLKLIS
jgi:hypothetical protein